MLARECSEEVRSSMRNGPLSAYAKKKRAPRSPEGTLLSDSIKPMDQAPAVTLAVFTVLMI